MINKSDLKTEYGDDYLIKMYLSEIRNIPVLSCEEEVKLGKDLKLINNIKDIIIIKKINGNLERIIDLDKIFGSIIDDKVLNVVVKIIKNYCSVFGRCECYSDKVLEYYIYEYEKLYNILGYVPSIKELNSYFSNNKKYNVFNDFYTDYNIDSIELIKKICNYVKYMVARNKMIESNLKLVVSIAKKYNSLMELLDLFSEGNRSLIEAVDRFDIDKGVKFSSYASSCIEYSIIDAIYIKEQKINRPVYFSRKIVNFKRNVQKLEQKYLRELSINEIAKELNISIDSINKMLLYNDDNVKSIYSEHENLHDGTKSILLDTIASDINVEKEVFDNNLKDELGIVLDKLNEKDREILMLRYGINSDRIVPMTREAIGKKFGVTNQAIDDRERKIYKKIKRTVKGANLKEFLYN